MFYQRRALRAVHRWSNLYAAAKALGFDIDYKLLRNEFMKRGKLVRAFYYTALVEDQEYSRSGRWSTGSTTTASRWSPSRPRSSPTPAAAARSRATWTSSWRSTRWRCRASIDTWCCFQRRWRLPPLVAMASSARRCKVSVVSTIRTSPPMIADDLRRTGRQLHRPEIARSGDRPGAVRARRAAPAGGRG
jgi:hypothetical protein